MKPFCVYMLRCNDSSYYVGHTDDLERRMAQHADGTLGGYTLTRRPLRLVWCAEFATRDEALQRELQVKSWSRAKKEALISSDWQRLKRHARGPDRAPVHPSTTCEPGGSHYARDERKLDARDELNARDERKLDARDELNARDERKLDARDGLNARDERKLDARNTDDQPENARA